MTITLNFSGSENFQKLFLGLGWTWESPKVLVSPNKKERLVFHDNFRVVEVVNGE